jgi:preprotein translocase subunit SecA
MLHITPADLDRQVDDRQDGDLDRPTEQKKRKAAPTVDLRPSRRGPITLAKDMAETCAIPFYWAAQRNTGKSRLVRYRWTLRAIERQEATLVNETDEDLRRRSLSLRYRAKTGESLSRLLVEAYALMREVCRRVLGMRHFPVQILGAIAMHDNAIAEMATGEGKTLTATMPVYLHALAGRGVLVATANDYLAKRDAEELRDAYEMLGMKVGCIEAQQPTPSRARAYQCDITYGTAKEFGFDFLRDQLLQRRIREGQFDLIGAMTGGGRQRHGDKPVQREPFYILVDEADSLMIDEARTPLIISALPGAAEKVLVASYEWASEACHQFHDPEHYTYDFKRRTIELTVEGRRLARTINKPALMNTVPTQSIYDYIERAIRAQRDFHKDQHYVVRDDEIVIVDENTGRLGEGRKWRDGLHQAIEAKEKVKVGVDSGQAARVTVQDYFSRFPKLGGMTGTASNAATEFRKVYKVQPVAIPTHKRSQRKQYPTRIFGTADAKWQAVIEEIRTINATGRPILVGTRNIDQSEHLSQLLIAAKIDHEVLNAHHLEKEAEIVAQAGEPGRVTVATNMAGRGTDIKLGPGVADKGGLYVICTEMHDTSRIDRQLIGRCARQGDPGGYRFFMSLEDELLKNAYGPKRAKKLAAWGKRLRGEQPRLSGMFKSAQRKVETKHYRDRKVLLYYEKERKKAQIQMGQDPYLDTPY